jgi:hypothetical protein
MFQLERTLPSARARMTLLMPKHAQTTQNTAIAQLKVMPVTANQTHPTANSRPAANSTQPVRRSRSKASRCCTSDSMWRTLSRDRVRPLTNR